MTSCKAFLFKYNIPSYLFFPLVTQGSHIHDLNLDIAEKVGNRKNEELQYLKLGDSYSEMGHFQDAIDSYEEYLRICKEQQDKAGEGRGYGKLGKVYYSVGDLRQAQVYFKQQQSIAKQVADKKEEGKAISSLCSCYLHYRDFRMAVKLHCIHLSISKELGDRFEEGVANGFLGMVRYATGDFPGAKEYFLQQLTICQELGDQAGEGKVYGNLGRLHRRLSDFEGAIEYHKKQLSIAEKEGRKDEQFCAHYEMGCNLESLEYVKEASECYMSSALLLNDMRADLRSQENSVFKDEWMIKLFNEIKHVYTALCRISLKLDFDLKALWAAEQGRSQALTDFLVFRYGINTAQIFSGEQKETPSDILKHISTNTVFLEIDSDDIYILQLFLGEPVRKTSWHVDNASTFLTTLIRDAYRSIHAPRLTFCVRRPTSSSKEHLYSGDPFRILYDKIFAAVADQFQGDELAIIPCGPLWLVPFAALVNPESKYLCESFRIRIAPSLTSLKLIAECPQGYHWESGALIVGDPYFKEIVTIFGKPRVVPLPCARQEAEMIAQLVNVKALVGREATKMKVLEQLNSVALVHFASHGDENGIVLSPNPTRSYHCPEEKDYKLTMADVTNVKVRAKLVVLSSCHSGQGEIKAEGVLGIVRAFLAAGARSVLASLWAIDDEATFEFMKSFYQHLVDGNKASKALNKAMKCLRESDEYSAVEHWAPFVLFGDDVTLKLPFAGIAG